MYSLSSFASIIFCLIITLIIAKFQAKRNKSTTQRLFRYTIVAWCAYLVCIMLLHLISGKQFFLARPICIFLNFIFVYIAANLGFVWFWYFVLSFVSDKLYTTKHQIISAIPAFILIITAFISMKTGWIFSVDETNTYVRGPLYALNFLGSYSYIFVTTIWTVVLIVRAQNRHERRLYWSVLSYGIYPILTGVIQAFNGALEIESFGITLTIVSAYLSLQEEKITVDALTQLNNRYRLESYLTEKARSFADGQYNNNSLFYVMLDVNKFKQINDKFGHLEGDHALKNVARVLSEMANTHQYFLARYGGDEFSIVCERYSIKEVEELCDEIKTAVRENNDNPLYELSVSAGCAKYEGKEMYLSDLIELADKRLYEDKKTEKKKNKQNG